MVIDMLFCMFCVVIGWLMCRLSRLCVFMCMLLC